MRSKKRLHFPVACAVAPVAAVVLLLPASPLSAGPLQQCYRGPVQGQAGVHGPVSTDQMPAYVPVTPLDALPGVAPSGAPVGSDLLRELKQQAGPVTAEPEAAFEDDATDAARAPTPLLTDFRGITYTGWIPPDPVVAAGPTALVVCVNSSWAIYNKDGTQGYITSFTNWFANVNPADPDFIFDPKVIYDNHSGRWVILALSRNNATNQSSYLISVSDDADPYGQWWNWNLDATLDGSTPTNNWADYPGLGYDYDEAVYITSNQFQFGGSFQYAKIRILYKYQLYWVGAGGPLNWWDFWNMTNQDGSTVFTIKPAECLTPSSGNWLLNSIWNGSNYVTLWRLFNPLGSPPTLTRRATVSVRSYVLPPDAFQLGDTARIETNTCYTQDVVYCSGPPPGFYTEVLYTSFTEGWDWGSGTRSAIRYLAIDTTGTVITDQTYGQPESDYYFPKTTPDRNCECLTLVFSRSSTSEYASVRYTGDYGNNYSSAYIKAGEGPYVRYDGNNRNRWGDYSGIWHDPSDNTIWMFGEYAEDNNTWGTWFGQTGCGCCNNDGIRGDANYLLDGVNVADLTYLVDYLFFGGPPPPCWEEGDVNADDDVNIVDVTWMVQYLFQGGPPPLPCP